MNEKDMIEMLEHFKVPKWMFDGRLSNPTSEWQIHEVEDGYTLFFVERYERRQEYTATYLSDVFAHALGLCLVERYERKLL
ncbi:hypothetical protein [Hyphobacterium sp.]|uniref:hypothetical protein n=1 Tax=Hyphobacterium sp. TaxID=2004662 RepID=UPI00374A260B